MGGTLAVVVQVEQLLIEHASTSGLGTFMTFHFHRGFIHARAYSANLWCGLIQGPDSSFGSPELPTLLRDPFQAVSLRFNDDLMDMYKMIEPKQWQSTYGRRFLAPTNCFNVKILNICMTRTRLVSARNRRCCSGLDARLLTCPHGGTAPPLDGLGWKRNEGSDSKDKYVMSAPLQASRAP